MHRLTDIVRRLSWVLLVILLMLSSSKQVYANAICKFSAADCAALEGPWAGWVPDSGGSSCNTDTTIDTSATASSSVAQKIGNTLILGFDVNTSKDVILKLATEYHIGGIYLIGTNVPSGGRGAQFYGFTKSFYDSLRQAAGGPVVISSDEEGVVSRYDYGGVSFPSAANMTKQATAAKSDAVITTIGKNVGKVMADNGLTTDLGPVLDLRDVGNGLTGRSFSSDPDVVAKSAGAFAGGLKASGIVPIFKHFPGFDDTTSGSTDDVKVVMKGSINKTVVPYKKLLAKYPDAGVMLSNLYVNALDKDNPSSMSSATVKDYLRKTLDFKGFITTDDLGVRSVTSKAGSLGDAVADSLQAGVSMPLFTLPIAPKQGETPTQAAEDSMNAIVGTVQNNSAAMSAIDDSKSIVAKFKGSSTTTATPPATATGCCGTTTLSGDDNQTKIFNYFIGKGLPAAAAAGIMGNMSAESTFNPAAEQSPGAWEDMSDLYFGRGGKGGVGLVQWDGPRRPGAINFMMAKGLTDADFHQASDKLLGAELDRVWAELSGSYADTLATIEKDTDPGQAAFDFHHGYEGSQDSADAIKQNRMDPAVAIFAKFSGSSTGTGGDASGGSCSSLPPDCTSAVGVAKIICAAKAYDTASYLYGASPRNGPAWHKQCTTIGPSCYIDCSLLVTLAVYDAFGVVLPGTDTGGERDDIGKYWKKISLNEVQPGDILQPEPGHVEVVDHVKGLTIYTFGAHESGIPQPDQVNPSSYSYDSSNFLFLHYIGKGV